MRVNPFTRPPSDIGLRRALSLRHYKVKVPRSSAFTLTYYVDVCIFYQIDFIVCPICPKSVFFSRFCDENYSRVDRVDRAQTYAARRRESNV